MHFSVRVRVRVRVRVGVRVRVRVRICLMSRAKRNFSCRSVSLRVCVSVSRQLQRSLRYYF